MKNFISLTKPGIIFGNGIAVVGGYFLGAHSHFDWRVFLMALLGISLIIASAGAFNNFIDRDIDRLMERTRNRPMARDLIQAFPALAFGTVLGVLGSVVLILETNLLTAIVAFFGFFIYVVIYSLWLKRTSIHGTVVGSLSGAVPPVVGYCAATNRFDLPALLLILILCFWQMPHSYAIGFYRASDFRNARIPLLPLLKSAPIAKALMLIYAGGFVVTSVLLTILGYTGLTFALFMGIGGLFWVIQVAQGFWAKDDGLWARKVFLTSILMVTLLSLMLVVDASV
jgi:protoheme IX farnesyltransferase